MVQQQMRASEAMGVPPPPTVLVVDDDYSVREALRGLFESVGLCVELFASPAELIKSNLIEGHGCLILDIRLPGTNGLDFHQELIKKAVRLPVIFITGHGDIPMSVRAMKSGAIDFLSKPFRDQDLIDAVHLAINRDALRLNRAAVLNESMSRFASLTQREREAFKHVVSGLMNKQIAAAMSLSEITVKVHRANLMRKMGARSLAELVLCAEQLSDALASGADLFA